MMKAGRSSLISGAIYLLASLVILAGGGISKVMATQACIPSSGGTPMILSSQADSRPLAKRTGQGASMPATKAKQTITITVLPGKKTGIKGPDGLHHDMIVPSNFVLYKGQRTTLVIYNYDEGPHTITCGALGLNIIIKPAVKAGKIPSRTVCIFTPRKKGTFRWHCVMPCDGGGHHWAMSQSKQGLCQNGYMAGYFIVLP